MRFYSYSSLRADRRGAVAFEMPFVFGFMVLSILVPLGDVAGLAFKYISAYQALRDVGQLVQYSPPPDITNWKGSSWASSIPATEGGFPITLTNIFCGDNATACSSGNPAIPRYYSFTTSFTYSPLIIGKVLGCSKCTYNLAYAERFQ